MRLSDWIKQTPMPDFGAFCSQVVWVVGSLALTTADYLMLTSAEELSRQAGLVLAGMLLAAWTGKSVVNFASNRVQRHTSREYLKAKGEADSMAQPTTQQVTAEHATVTQEVVG